MVEASKQLQCVGVSEQETLGMKGTPIVVCIFGFLFPPTLQQSVLKACGLRFRFTVFPQRHGLQNGPGKRLQPEFWQNSEGRKGKEIYKNGAGQTQNYLPLDD